MLIYDGIMLHQFKLERHRFRVLPLDIVVAGARI